MDFFPLKAQLLIVFQDGVSEGQFSQVLEEGMFFFLKNRHSWLANRLLPLKELPKIKSMCSSLNKYCEKTKYALL